MASNIQTTPEPWGSLIDKLMELDAKYFEDHPGVKQFDRSYVFGEMYPVLTPAEDVAFTRVHYIDKGLRAREVMCWNRSN